jgi:hypothetical protein
MKLEKSNPPMAEIHSFIFGLILYFPSKSLPLLRAFFIIDKTNRIAKMAKLMRFWRIYPFNML